MKRRDFAALLLAAGTAGCSWFDWLSGNNKQPLPGQRLPVLGIGNELEADPRLAGDPVTLPPAAANPDWPEPGGNPAHAMGRPALPPRLAQAWQTSVGEGSSDYTRVLAPPVVSGGRVYAMDGGVQVSAMDAATGRRLWQVDLTPKGQQGNAFGGGPCFWQGRLYVATGFSEVLALDPANGHVIWRQSVSAPVHAPPTVAAGRIFTVTVDNRLDVVATTDGHALWSHSGIPETADLIGGASPAVENEVVVVGYTSGELYALTVDNGRPVWTSNLAAIRDVNAIAALADIRGRPIIDRGLVFAVSHSGLMAAIDLRTGDRAWEQEIGSSSSPWSVGDYVFVLAGDNEMACLTRKEGKIRWLRRLPSYKDEKSKSDPIYWTGPTLGGDRLIAVSSNSTAMYVAPETGEIVGRQDLADAGYIGPVIADNTLYILTDDANLTAYR
ncbi:MAG TPA: PQQ-binding-like beta-propeller repeat protein [Stellaceae bacterium]|nr:PQQ-binding-like beta-propeller repeat protein [Stellaceae bacterium]